MKAIGVVVRTVLVVLGAGSLSACSVIWRVEIFNNSGRVIEVCYEPVPSRSCVTILANSSAEFLNHADETSPWNLRVQADGRTYVYDFTVAGKPEFAWDHICHGMNPRCDVALQLEPNLELHWVEKPRKLPADEFPAQPDGFPVTPTA